MAADELSEALEQIRERIRQRYNSTGSGAIQPPLPDLMPLLHTRDAALGKVAAIGTVNPRRGGPLNALIQAVKKTVARMLDWHVREQVEFNRHAVSAMEATLEALNDTRNAITAMASQASALLEEQRRDWAEQQRALSDHLDAFAAKMEQVQQRLRTDVDAELGNASSQAAALAAEARELADIRLHWAEWRAEWERKLAINEIQFLRSAADLQGGFQHRATLMEGNFRETVRAQHQDYLSAMRSNNDELQERFWKEVEKVRITLEGAIHRELRLVRQKQAAAPRSDSPAEGAAAPALDWAAFADRFRGSEQAVREQQQVYREIFAGCSSVLDIGCGRGEFLEVMRDAGIGARGIDLSEECVAACRAKSLDAEAADLFPYLESIPSASLDGLNCSQVVEHLSPAQLPRLLELAGRAVAPGGRIAIETPNPQCLAIFATHFYLDPTHTRPVPHPLLGFYLEEQGFGDIRVRWLADAAASFQELEALPEAFRKSFFGGLDYLITAVKL